ncbi:hypothetical protein ENKNEFLB_02259 [Nocardioides aquaticus]|jgi:hypothetical protein|uniref:Uncharacterized protein n=1 Tax=Nocardioides aquaticus TaxID=160826 RepID=A0ABX8EH74_9ACTN|nr:hypothetical protein [Nocardioides aquaticus]QVT79869.1 hypothetical protein ENKNEFLB_02259 [Nocardioides aquaticus]
MTALDTSLHDGPARGHGTASGAPLSSAPGALGAGGGPVQRVADASVWLLFRLSGVRS